jgi:hypothetical protein
MPASGANGRPAAAETLLVKIRTSRFRGNVVNVAGWPPTANIVAVGDT